MSDRREFFFEAHQAVRNAVRSIQNFGVKALPYDQEEDARELSSLLEKLDRAGERLQELNEIRNTSTEISKIIQYFKDQFGPSIGEGDVIRAASTQNRLNEIEEAIYEETIPDAIHAVLYASQVLAFVAKNE